jgi:hypothetical protein
MKQVLSLLLFFILLFNCKTAPPVLVINRLQNDDTLLVNAKKMERGNLIRANDKIWFGGEVADLQTINMISDGVVSFSKSAEMYVEKTETEVHFYLTKGKAQFNFLKIEPGLSVRTDQSDISMEGKAKFSLSVSGSCTEVELIDKSDEGNVLLKPAIVRTVEKRHIEASKQTIVEELLKTWQDKQSFKPIPAEQKISVCDTDIQSILKTGGLE